MRNILNKLFLVLILCLSILFVSNLSNTKISADNEYSVVKDNNGATVYYRNSNEPVMKLTEYNYPTQQLRACWVSLFVGSMSNYDSESKWKTAYNLVLDTMEEYGLNCIIFHVRTHNNAFYKSELNPIATWMKWCNFDEFDPIEWSIEETHKRGIEFHAWMNPYRVSTTYCAESFPSVNPASDSKNLLVGSSSTILDPGLPNVRKFLVDTCMEFLERYDADAIHFDDYFYTAGIDDSATRKTYNTSGMSTDNFRREQVNLFIEALSKAIREHNVKNNKAVQLGIAPSGIYSNGSYVSYDKYTWNSNGDLTYPLASNTAGSNHYAGSLYADTVKWINKEWIDYMMPQAYWAIEHTSASYAELARWWSAVCKNKKVNLYMGMGIYMGASTTGSGAYWQKNYHEIDDQLKIAGMYNEIGGFSLYSYNYMKNNATSIKTGMDILKNDFCKTKIPADVKKYLADQFDTIEVKGLSVENTTLKWEKQDGVRGHIIYKVKKSELLNQNDINQIYYYGNDSSVNLDDVDNYSYYISTVNMANEISKPLNTEGLTTTPEYLIQLINNLPVNVKLEDEAKITRIEEIYNNFSSENKAKVTNYNKYLEKKELLDTKKEVIEYCLGLGTLANYTTDTQNSIVQERIKLKGKINNLATLEEIENEKIAYETWLEALPHIDVELREPRQNATKELTDYYNAIEKKYYTSANQTSLQKFYTQGLVDINKAKSKADVTKVVENTIKALDGVKSFKDKFDIGFADIKERIDDNVKFHLNNNEWLARYKNLLDNKVQSYIYKMENTDTERVAYLTDDAASEYIQEIDDYVNNTLYQLNRTYKNVKLEIELSSEKKEGSKELKSEYLTKVEETFDETELNNLLTEFNEKFKQLGNKGTTPTDPVEPDPKPSKKCQSKSFLVIELLSSISLIYILLKKK